METDSSTMTLHLSTAPTGFDTSSDPVTAGTLYLDQGPNFWLQKQCPHWSAEGGEAAVFFVACRRSGRIEILKLPEFESVWKAEAAVEGASLLLDAAERAEGAGSAPDSEQGVFVREVVMEQFGRSGSRPYLLLLLSDGQLLVYHSFSFQGGGAGGEAGGRRLGRLRWVRRPLEWECGEGGGMKVFHQGRHRGVFVCGPHPLWLMEHRQRLRAHPHEGDGPITAFAPLHNKHCPHGFIVTTGGGALKVGRLPPDIQFDNDWPLLKVPQHHSTAAPQQHLTSPWAAADPAQGHPPPHCSDCPKRRRLAPLRPPLLSAREHSALHLRGRGC